MFLNQLATHKHLFIYCVIRNHNVINSWAQYFIYYSEGWQWMYLGGPDYNPNKDTRASGLILQLGAKRSLLHFQLT